jgi:hypothetical protein
MSGGHAVGRSGGRTRPRRRGWHLFAALMLAACQPQARRALVLDLALSDPLALDATAQPWQDAGYTVEYRRFYPHLTRADLGRYHVLLLLSGRAPERPSDALTAGDLALLSEWVHGGGVAVLGYAAAGEGSLDRWLINRWLAWEGAGIAIGEDLLRDTTPAQTATGAYDPQPAVESVPSPPLRDVGAAPFPAGRNHALLVADPAQALARTTATAFVRPAGGPVRPGSPPLTRARAVVLAATRLRDGLVIVVSRHALSALGTDVRASTVPALGLDDLAAARTFLTALARWTRRPAEWARIPPSRSPRPLVLINAPRPVSETPPPFAPPPAATAGRTGVVTLPTPLDPRDQRRPAAPDWIGRAGQRIVWGHFAALQPSTFGSQRLRSLDSLVAFLEAGGINVFAGDAFAGTLADTARGATWERDAIRNAWKQTGDVLETTSLLWIPTVEPAEFRLPADTAVQRGGAGGRDTLAVWCALDPRYWAEEMAPTYRALAQLAAAREDLIPAIALDLDPPTGRRPSEDPFCDAAWRTGLARLPRDSAFPAARADAFASLPSAARYDSLLVSGLLGRYYDALEDAVAERAAAIRTEVRRIRGDLGFAFVTRRPPVDWLSLGLLRGFSSLPPDPPLLIWSPEVRTRDLLARARARGIVAVTAVGLAPAHLPAAAWGSARLARVAFRENSGFWIAPLPELLAAPRVAEGRITPDSLGRLLRRLVRER